MSEFLNKSIPITSQKWSENTKPFLSIGCLTYNHEKFISDAIEGFLMQKTTFPVRIVIFEDCSTDNTASIIKEYEERYPDIFRVFYQPKNTYGKPIRQEALKPYREERAKAKYIALCEGDDYWTDPLKLQKQVDFLEGNEDCSLCFHASKSIRNNNPDDYTIHKPKEIPTDNKFEMKHAILGGGGFMATNSMVFLSKYSLERPKWIEEAPVGDLPLMLLLASKGRMGYIDDVMSVYRIMSSPDSWSASMQNRDRSKKHHYAILKMWTDFDEWSNSKYHKCVVKKKSINRKGYLRGNIRYILKKIIRK